jgi:N-acylglucosamine-6-phosphate 2-epimerase
MKNDKVLAELKGKLVVSCQALLGEPLYGSDIMAKMALAAMLGGASGIRANSVEDIIEIKKQVNLPIIGIIKKDYEDSEVYITPTIKEVEELCSIGIDIIAVDFTNRVRPKGQTLEAFVKEIKERFPQQIIMADISTVDEGIMAEALGADLVSTTLSGYTSYSPRLEGPDYELVKKLSTMLKIPVMAEGRIHSPEEAKRLLECGAYALIIGGAITRPLEITKRFINKIDSAV